jgi:RNA-directed DNA polymerase
VQPPNVGVYADDLVILHKERTVVEPCQQLVSAWLRPMGLALQPSKTRIPHTRKTIDDLPGFDCLSFHLRQYPAGKTTSGRACRGRLHGVKTSISPSHAAIMRQRTTVRQTIARHPHAAQPRLIDALHPRMRGWSTSSRHVSSAQGFRP